MQEVIKASGEREKFNSKKIYRGIVLAGGSKKLASDTLDYVRKNFKQDITTEEILSLVLKSLKSERGVAARYDLKRAVMSLGPSGFPFETYFSAILSEHGYKTSLRQVLKGKNVSQEIDIIAKNKHSYMVECKYHNNSGNYAGLKEAMYTYARFLDVKKYHLDFPWLATNTKCSDSAKNYAKGVDLKITSWNFPKDESLQKMIEDKKLYPVTLVRDISSENKNKLYSAHVMFIRDLVNLSFNDLKRKTKISDDVLKKIISEAKEILG